MCMSAPAGSMQTNPPNFLLIGQIRHTSMVHVYTWMPFFVAKEQKRHTFYCICDCHAVSLSAACMYVFAFLRLECMHSVFGCLATRASLWLCFWQRLMHAWLLRACWCTFVYDCNSLCTCDKLQVAGWWLGMLGDEVGWFPKSYCMEINNDCTDSLNVFDVDDDPFPNTGERPAASQTNNSPHTAKT